MNQIIIINDFNKPNYKLSKCITCNGRRCTADTVYEGDCEECYTKKHHQQFFINKCKICNENYNDDDNDENNEILKCKVLFKCKHHTCLKCYIELNNHHHKCPFCHYKLKKINQF